MIQGSRKLHLAELLADACALELEAHARLQVADHQANALLGKLIHGRLDGDDRADIHHVDLGHLQDNDAHVGRRVGDGRDGLLL